MTEWKTIPAKFTLEEKQILDKLKERYGLNYNQSLRGGINLLSRFIAIAEFYVTIENKTIKKIGKISKTHTKNSEIEIKEILKKIPIEEQEAQFQKLADGISKIVSQADNIFVDNRKRGRKPLKRKRGRPKNLGKTS